MTTPLQPLLKQIVIYPVKSLDGKIVTRSKISPGGALEFDRRWAIVDARGRVINGKNTAKIHQLRTQYDFLAEDRLSIRLHAQADSTSYTFCLNTELVELSQWLSQFFGFPVSTIENDTTGFPDDLAAYGPTIVSTATLETICEWFPDLDLAEVRRRFRTNLELSGVPAFWEDRLFGAPGNIVNFQLGSVQFYGVNPCQRCIVPTRNSLSGDVSPKFQQIFTHQRQQTFPERVDIARFNHFYRLAINTQIPLGEAGKWLAPGDLISCRDDEAILD
jgi:uncharacterized protein